MAKARAKIRTLGPGATWAGNPKGSLSGKAPSSRRKPKAAGIDPGNPHYGIQNTTRKHTSAVTQPAGRNVPSAQGKLTSKAKRQVG